MSEQRDYGTPENPNLENITIELIHSVNEYQRLLPNVILDIEQVGKIDPMYLTPDKPNTARKVIPVRERIVSRGGSEMGDKIGDIYAILFRLGDGTGDQNTYKVDELDLPTNYFGFDNDNKVGLLPRKKDCIMEAFFPFFSIANNQIYRNLTSLTELTVDDIENPEVLFHIR